MKKEATKREMPLHSTRMLLRAIDESGLQTFIHRWRNFRGPSKQQLWNFFETDQIYWFL